MEERVFKGYNGNMIVSDAGVTITRGAKGFVLQGGMLRGEKLIPWESIERAGREEECGVVIRCWMISRASENSPRRHTARRDEGLSRLCGRSQGGGQRLPLLRPPLLVRETAGERFLAACQSGHRVTK